MSLRDEVDIIEHRLEQMRQSEALVSDAYVRLRILLEPWGSMNTLSGGADRFERTEQALESLLKEYAHLKQGIRTLYASGI